MPAEAGPVGLVLPGGGARAAYQAGALQAIAAILPPGPSPFRVIAGQSAGAINAAALASRAEDFPTAVGRIVDAWSGLSVSDVVRTDPARVGLSALRWTLTAASGGWLLRNPRAILDNAPLRRTLAREIDFGGIDRAIATGALDALAITASAYSDAAGQAVTFFAGGAAHPDWFRIRRCGLRRTIGAGHVVASSALPFVFPAEEIEGQFFGDGALRLTAPLSPAIRLGAERILVIAARDPEVPRLDRLGPADYPSLGDLVGHMLDILFNDHLDSDIERLRRINATIALMTPDQARRSALRPLEVLVLRPSEDLRAIAGRTADELPWTLRMLLRGIGGWGGDWRLPSYLTFSSGYCRALIRLGHRDAMARRDEIAAFLGAG